MKIWGVRLLSVALALAAVFGGEAILGGLLAGNQGFDYIYRLLVLAGLFVTLAVSLNLINGITGQFSIGHAAFYMVGAYTAGTISNTFFAKQQLDLSAWLIMMSLAGAAGAAIAGFIVGLPSLRLKGDYLAIVTLGFGEIIRIVVFNQQALGGPYGLNVAAKAERPFWAVWLLAILCIAVCRNLLKTSQGLSFLAVREDEVASSAMGVNVTKIKVTAFVVGSAFAGAAGAMLGQFDGFISPDAFRMDVSFLILTMVVLGGTGSITGSVVAALLLFTIPEWPRFLKDVQITGGGLAAWAIAIVGSVFLIKRTIDEFHGERREKTWRILGLIGGGVATGILLTFLFNLLPFPKRVWDFSNLRMVILAIALIVLMLLRPQGIFGHHEFNLQKFAKALGFKETKPA